MHSLLFCFHTNEEYRIREQLSTSIVPEDVQYSSTIIINIRKKKLDSNLDFFENFNLIILVLYSEI